MKLTFPSRLYTSHSAHDHTLFHKNSIPTDSTTSQQWTHSATQVSCTRDMGSAAASFFFTMSGIRRLMSGRRSFQRRMCSLLYTRPPCSQSRQR